MINDYHGISASVLILPFHTGPMNALGKPCKSELMANNRLLGVQLTHRISGTAVLMFTIALTYNMHCADVLMCCCADVHNCSHTICIVLRAWQLRERILSTTWPTTSFSSGLASTISAAAKPLLSVCHYPLPCFCFIISHFPSTLFLLSYPMFTRI